MNWLTNFVKPKLKALVSERNDVPAIYGKIVQIAEI